MTTSKTPKQRARRHTSPRSALRTDSAGSADPLRHPETGRTLLTPPGWALTDGCLYQFTDKDTRLVSRNPARVHAVAHNLATDEFLLEVRFRVGERQVAVTVPQRDVASSGGVLRHLAGKGAEVYGGNASQVLRFLFEDLALNRSALPVRRVSDALGALPNGVIVTPTHSVGGEGGEVRYIGEGAGSFGAAPEPGAYAAALREALGWPGSHSLWWTLGLALVSPLLPRLRPRFCPATYLAGDAGAGAVAAPFALGAWVTPGEARFELGGLSSAQTGLQALARLGGLPLLIGDAHSGPNPAALERIAAAFTHGLGARRAASPLGALLLTGEASPAFHAAGSRQHLLYLDLADHPPLGLDAESGSSTAAARVYLLEAACSAGAGHLGPALAGAILADWTAFEARVAALRRLADLWPLQAWGLVAAAVQATLEALCARVLQVQLPEVVRELPSWLSAALEAQRVPQNPAAEAFDAIRLLALQAKRERTPQGVSLSLRGEFIGWSTDSHWHLLTSSSVFRQRVGARTVQLFGGRWAEAGWISPDPTQGNTRSMYCAVRKGQARVLVIPRAVLETPEGDA